jgi:anti-sigma regulatory factor (Ser/Thr protein kinase)
MAQDAAHISLEPSRSEVARAREFATALLEEWGETTLIDDVVLAVSELVTNAVLHARTQVDVALRQTPRGLRIEVSDRSPAVPRTRTYGPTAATGRGLHLVAQLSSEWGVDRTTEGKSVWVEIHYESRPSDKARDDVEVSTEVEPDLAAFEAAGGWDDGATIAALDWTVAA